MLGANHDAGLTWDPTTDDDEIFWKGGVNRATFEGIARRWIAEYFPHENYYRIGGCPVFCLYHLPRFIEGIGGVEEVRDALDWLRDEAKGAGFPGIHLQNTYMNFIPGDIVDNVPGLESGPVEVARTMRFDSVTNYQWVHVAAARDQEYSEWGEVGVGNWDFLLEKFGSVAPHVSIGWDNNPRFPSYRPIIRNETPGKFEHFLVRAREFLDSHPDQHKLVTINSWNEWTEGSYLLPDEKNRYRFLEAVRAAFE